MLSALALNCSLKSSSSTSSTALLTRQLLDALADHGVDGDEVRVVDFDVRPGVEADMGDGDEWPQLRSRILAADILIFATPTWVGHMSSVAQRVLERLDAELAEKDDSGRQILADKVAAVVAVGNEDGAHAIAADAYQGLNDLGFSIPAQACVYWNGEAMHTVDYKDLDDTPDEVKNALSLVARNTAHLAAVLKQSGYPAP
jgi:multimeric flavodoxin WrbA